MPLYQKLSKKIKELKILRMTHKEIMGNLKSVEKQSEKAFAQDIL
jgi:hypothetical protein